MRQRFNVRQRNYIILGLCLILLVMAAGYAAFRSQFTINGTSNITSEWDIEITNIETLLPSQFGGDGIPGGYNISDPTYTPTSATFNAGFDLPGSMIGYIVEISNLGSIDGQVGVANLDCGDNDVIGCSVQATDENPYEGGTPSNGFSFENGSQDYSDINFPLKSGDKHYVIVMVGYGDVEEQPTDLDANIKLDLTYKQYVDPNRPIPSGEATLVGGQEVDIINSGNGLYEDEYESGRYVYRGANPSNYIEFNNELWRIISKEADGTYKIIRNETLGNKAFDGGRETEYCSNSNHGCNAWSSTANMVGSPSEFSSGKYTGTVEADSEMLTYLNGEFLGSVTVNHDKIINHDYNIGAVVVDNDDLTVQIEGEKAYKWNGNVGLISVSDYIKANSNQELCGTNKINYENYETCRNYDWMYINGTSWWTLSPRADTMNDVWYVYDDGSLSYAKGGFFGYGANDSYGVRPAVYLTSSLSLSGSGTQSDPFTIVS